MIQTLESPIIETYVSHVGQIDSEQKWPYAHDQLTDLSQRFGRVCVESAEQRVVPDMTHLRRILGIMYDDATERDYLRDRAKMLEISTGLLDGGTNPNLLLQTQKALQKETALQLEKNLEHMNHRSDYVKGHIKGRVAELVTLGSINFLEDPNFVAIPALPHHDQNPKPSNSYDVLLLYQKRGKPSVQQIQVKFKCQNFCDRPLVQPHKNNDQRKYNHRIAIVSGHCDIGMNPQDLSYGDMLARSTLKPETITNNEFDKLFSIGNSLIKTLTGANLKDRLGRTTLGSTNWRKTRGE